MKRIDVFNGDADGLCALHQWRLAYPVASRLVTGVKRDINLLMGLDAEAGDFITVFDISFDSNREDVARLLAAGVSLSWFDHHYQGVPLVHAGLDATVDTSADVCTSLLVDRVLGGQYRAWAVVAAFGDNLPGPARQAATSLGLTEGEIDSLSELGELLNYNSYGASVEDLHFVPADLYQQMAGYLDPLAFMVDCPAIQSLRAAYGHDLRAAESLPPCFDESHAAAWLLPNAAWARRVIGVMANRLAVAAPDRAHALLAPNSSGNLTVSVRAPKNNPNGADELCRRFATGGGRKAAAGINRLPLEKVDSFLLEFSAYYRNTMGISEGSEVL
jgi:hypothetical protein